MKFTNVSHRISLGLLAAAALHFAAVVALPQTIGVPKKENLLNGFKVLMWSNPIADKVWVKLRIHAGSAFDPQGKEGTMQLLADNLFPTAVSTEFFREDLGGGLEIITNYDYIQINAFSKPESFLTMLETIATAVSNPSIDKETTARLRTALLSRVGSPESDPAYTADQAVAKRLFGTFPYGRPQLGTAASLQSIDFADLLEAKQRFLTADNATIAISGNFDKATGFRAVRRYFGGWLKSDKQIPATFRQPDQPPTALFDLPFPKTNAWAMRFAIRGVARSDKYLAASLIFTNLLESRLKARVPANNVSVFVRNEPHILPGVITIGFSPVISSDGGNGKTVFRDLVVKTLSEPVSEAEFQTAKKVLLTEWAAKDAETLWLDADTYKTAGPDREMRTVEGVSLSDVQAYAEKARQLPLVSVSINLLKS